MNKTLQISSYLDSLTREEIIILYRALSLAIRGDSSPKVYGETEDNIRGAVHCSLADVADVIGRSDGE